MSMRAATTLRVEIISQSLVPEDARNVYGSFRFMPNSHPLRFRIGTRKVPRCGVGAIGAPIPRRWILGLGLP